MKEELEKLIKENFYDDHENCDDSCGKKADYTENCTNVVMRLITADRKRITLKAKIETVISIDAMLRFKNIPLHPVQAESLKQYLRQLEAQQEEV